MSAFYDVHAIDTSQSRGTLRRHRHLWSVSEQCGTDSYIACWALHWRHVWVVFLLPSVITFMLERSCITWADVAFSQPPPGNCFATSKWHSSTTKLNEQVSSQATSHFTWFAETYGKSKQFLNNHAYHFMKCMVRNSIKMPILLLVLIVRSCGSCINAWCCAVVVTTTCLHNATV